MTTYQPYVYRIGWSKLDLWYIGCRYGDGCSPSDLWETYFTSSQYVRAVRYVSGEPDTFQTIVVNDKEDALAREAALLFYTGAVKSKRYINRANFRNSGTLEKEAAKRRSAAHIGLKRSDETCRLLSKQNRERARTELLNGKPISTKELAKLFSISQREVKERLANGENPEQLSKQRPPKTINMTRDGKNRKARISEVAQLEAEGWRRGLNQGQRKREPVNTKQYALDGRTQSISKWAAEFGIPASEVRYHMRNGKTLAQIRGRSKWSKS